VAFLATARGCASSAYDSNLRGIVIFFLAIIS
jgi:hypothetical protein